MYPFLFRVGDGEDCRWMVKIAVFDYVYYDATWMVDPTMPEGKVWVPDVDLTKETRVFDTEQAALEYIREWWTT